MRYLAVDIGDRYIGLAIGEIIAQPYTTLECKDQFPYEEIKVITEKEGVDKVIVGIPAHIATGDQKAKEYEQIAQRLKGDYQLNVETLDETLTSQAANERLKEMGYTWQESKKKIHEVSAQIILEDYLNRHE